jgi:hypothetical protein
MDENKNKTLENTEASDALNMRNPSQQSRPGQEQPTNQVHGHAQSEKLRGKGDPQSSFMPVDSGFYTGNTSEENERT